MATFVRARLAKGAPVLVDDREAVMELPSKWLWMLRHRRGQAFAISGIELYGKRLKVFLTWLERRSVFQASGLTLPDVLRTVSAEELAAWVKARSSEVEPATLYSEEVAVKRFFAWLTTAEAGRVIETSPFDGLSRLTRKSHKRLPRFVPEPALKSLLLALQAEPARCYVHFTYDTGVRVSELCRLTRADMPLAESYPDEAQYLPMVIPGVKGRGGQTKERMTLISRAVLARVQRYHASPAYRFAGRWPANDPLKPMFLNSWGRPLKPPAVRDQMARAAKKAGLPANIARPHALRHGMAYSLLGSELGKGLLDRLLIAQRALGHADISTTEIYTHIPADVLIKLSRSGDAQARFIGAQQLFDETFLRG